MKRAGLGVILCLCSSAALADEVPITGPYGTLSSCILSVNGATQNIVVDDSFILLEPNQVQGMEWSCQFVKVLAAGPSTWKAVAHCGDEGEESTSTMLLAATQDGLITISDADFLTSPLVLPRCDLPYGDQVRMEALRLKNNQ